MDALDREFNEMCNRVAPPGSKPSFPPASAYAPSSPLGTMVPAVFSPAEEARLREEFTRQLLGGKLQQAPTDLGRMPPASTVPQSPKAMAQMAALFAAMQAQADERARKEGIRLAFQPPFPPYGAYS